MWLLCAHIVNTKIQLMARSKETYNKRQREAKRQKQLQEKKQKAEDRKLEKKSGNLEDMMVYLDENGNFTDTPPDPSRRVEIAAEEIQISVPRLEDRESDEDDGPRTGTIAFLNSSKGYGFINDTKTGERLFFHVSELTESVGETDNVTYTVADGPRGPQATGVSKIK